METKELTNEDVREEDIRKIQKELLKQAKKNQKAAEQPIDDIKSTVPTKEKQVSKEMMDCIKSLPFWKD